MITEHVGMEGTILSNEIPHTRKDFLIGLIAELAEHWTSIPKVAGSIPTVVRLTFQSARCGYTLRVTSKTLFLLSNECSLILV